MAKHTWTLLNWDDSVKLEAGLDIAANAKSGTVRYFVTIGDDSVEITEEQAKVLIAGSKRAK